ncbi:MAG: hypothetical protein HUK19_02275 [Fibrobacter sp.]|nr:hypothetical protein [Fibrobacter sp.]
MVQDNQPILEAIQKEITIAYESIGRKSPETAPIIAESLQDAIGFSSPGQVHEAFRRAKDVEHIPSQKILKEMVRNIAEEYGKYETQEGDRLAIGFTDRTEAWLPRDDVLRSLNLSTAIKNYCAAVGNKAYKSYLEAHRTDVERLDGRRIVKWSNPSKVAAFRTPIVKYLGYLYGKYWRSLPIASGYPSESELSVFLIPPSVQQFRTMLDAEGQPHE